MTDCLLQDLEQQMNKQIAVSEADLNEIKYALALPLGAPHRYNRTVFHNHINNRTSFQVDKKLTDILFDTIDTTNYGSIEAVQSSHLRYAPIAYLKALFSYIRLKQKYDLYKCIDFDDVFIGIQQDIIN